MKRLLRYTLEIPAQACSPEVSLHRLIRSEDWKEEVFIGKAVNYDQDIISIISSGMEKLGVTGQGIVGKHIVLKPNLVETSSAKTACINTHPHIIRAAIIEFLNIGAAKVTIAEGAGHRRNSMILLEQSGLIDVMRETGASFVDLNYCDVLPVPNAGGATYLKKFMLPRVIREADFVVSMAKLKTHHWAGVTLSLKNLYGAFQGLTTVGRKMCCTMLDCQRSIYDVAATVGAHFAIVDGIIGMEGDGPIHGEPKEAGVLVMGRNLPAVDATCTRIMGIDPPWIFHLAACPFFLGPIHEAEISTRAVKPLTR